MKVLQVNSLICGGSTATLVEEIHKYLLQNNIESYIAYAYGKKVRNDNYFYCGNVVSRYLSALLTRIDGNRYGHLFMPTIRLIKLIKKISPTMIHIHCINAYSFNIFLLCKFLKKMNIPIIVTAHAFFFATGSCAYPEKQCIKYINGCSKCPLGAKQACKSILIDNTKNNWHKMKAAFQNGNFTFVGVSEYTTNIYKKSGITKLFDCKTIINGIDTNIFKYLFHPKNNKIKLLFVTSASLIYTKGIDRLIKIAELLEFDESYEIMYIGPKCNVHFPKNINCVFNVRDKQSLSHFYCSSDLTLMLSRNETFSLVTAESLCCGTPVAGFKSGGPESIGINQYSVFFGDDEMNLLIDFIKSKTYMNLDRCEMSKIARKKYSSKNMAKNYYLLYNNKN